MRKIGILILTAMAMCHPGTAQNTPWSSSNNVGIGTLSPTSKLEVSTDQEEVLDAIRIGSTSVGYTGAHLTFRGNTNVARITGSYEGYYGGVLKFKTSPLSGGLVDAMTITGNGNVGIGTIAPAYQLDVNGSASVSGNAMLGAATIGSHAAFTTQALFDPYCNSGTFVKMIPLYTGTVMAIDATDIYTQGGAPTVKITGNYSYANGPQLLIDGIQNNLYYKNKGIEINLARNGPNAYAGQDIGLSLNVSSNDGTAYALYSAAGKNYFADNVCIGTNDPKGYKLAVNGNAIFTRVKVQQYGAWADYVFEPTYKLPSLGEVEAFIKEHKHLPGVASAKEVQREGLDVGENQVVLLKKIEELTLYLIELKKEIEELKIKAKKSRNKQQ